LHAFDFRTRYLPHVPAFCSFCGFWILPFHTWISLPFLIRFCAPHHYGYVSFSLPHVLDGSRVPRLPFLPPPFSFWISTLDYHSSVYLPHWILQLDFVGLRLVTFCTPVLTPHTPFTAWFTASSWIPAFPATLTVAGRYLFWSGLPLHTRSQFYGAAVGFYLHLPPATAVAHATVWIWILHHGSLFLIYLLDLDFLTRSAVSGFCVYTTHVPHS